MIVTILYVFALVLFILAGLGIPSSRYSLIAFGLACLTATRLVGALGAG